MPYESGQSNNPNGRPKGARNKATLAAEALLDGEAEAITRKAIELAKGGDMTAIRLCLERIIPARRDRVAAFALPKVQSVADAVTAVTAIIEAVADGDLTPAEAAELSKVVDGFTRTVELVEIDERLSKLEGNKR
ncbi:MAG: hypothetical protein EXQ82_00465 [Pseudolabrys sp.]|nr:hypothetical protein [Pseudolabrys sp.]